MVDPAEMNEQERMRVVSFCDLATVVTPTSFQRTVKTLVTASDKQTIATQHGLLT